MLIIDQADDDSHFNVDETRAGWLNYVHRHRVHTTTAKNVEQAQNYGTVIALL